MDIHQQTSSSGDFGKLTGPEGAAEFANHVRDSVLSLHEILVRLPSLQEGDAPVNEYRLVAERVEALSRDLTALRAKAFDPKGAIPDSIRIAVGTKGADLIDALDLYRASFVVEKELSFSLTKGFAKEERAKLTLDDNYHVPYAEREKRLRSLLEDFTILAREA